MAHLYSMTGFGKATLQLAAKKITIEVKSLNSKQLDMNIRTPLFYREKEADIRHIVSNKVVRGKVDLSFYCEVTGAEKAPKINEALASEYIRQLKGLSEKYSIQGDVLSAVMRMPDVMQPAEDEVDEDEYDEEEEVDEALDPVDKDELKGKHKHRDDKDIDNDGDSDSTDKYLHKRRKAIGKAMKNRGDAY